MRPNSQDIQQEILRRRSSDVGYLLMTDEEIIQEIKNEKNPPIPEIAKKAKVKKRKKRRRGFQPGFIFRNG